MTYITASKSEEEGCVFCVEPQKDDREGLIVHRGKKAYVILNRYPYTSGHVMVVPYSHEPSLELIESESRAEMMELASKTITVLRKVYRPQGFNLGINIGEPAGAGIADHVHLHIVPRWTGDTNFMTAVGGTRVLPEALEETLRRVKEEWGRQQSVIRVE